MGDTIRKFTLFKPTRAETPPSSNLKGPGLATGRESTTHGHHEPRTLTLRRDTSIGERIAAVVEVMKLRLGSHLWKQQQYYAVLLHFAASTGKQIRPALGDSPNATQFPNPVHLSTLHPDLCHPLHCDQHV